MVLLVKAGVVNVAVALKPEPQLYATPPVAVKVVVLPEQIVVVPVMPAVGSEFTVTVPVALTLPQPPVKGIL